MDEADATADGINQKHGAAVGCVDAKANPRIRRNQPIHTGIKASRFAACDSHARAVDLLPGAKQTAPKSGFHTKLHMDWLKPLQNLPSVRPHIHAGLADRKPMERP